MCDTLSKNHINSILTSHSCERLISTKENISDASNNVNEDEGLQKCKKLDAQDIPQRLIAPSFLSSFPADQDVCGNLNPSTDSVKFFNKYIQPYKDINNRIKSFANWPKTSTLKPKDLAEAGFYYKGQGDKTVCFHCFGPLSDWESDDDPWEQHALWFPKCGYVSAKKGNEFIQEVHKKLKISFPNDWAFKHQESKECCEDGPQRTSLVEDDKMCIICCTRERQSVLVPCGHDWTCLLCVKSLEDKKCPVCREQIINIL